MDSIKDIRFEISCKIYESFSDVEILGLEHSLADASFADMWGQMPDESNFFDEGKFDDTAGVFRRVWASDATDEKTRSDIEYQIRNKEIINKGESWRSIRAEYLEKFSNGIYLLSENAFYYYMAGWMTLYLNKEVDPYRGISAHFFSWFVDPVFNRELVPPDDKKKTAIAMFLVYVALSEPETRNGANAVAALEKRWLEFAGNYRQLYEQWLAGGGASF